MGKVIRATRLNFGGGAASPPFSIFISACVEYLQLRCDYATGWSGSTLIIKEDISGEKNRSVDTRRIEKGILRKKAQFKDDVMKY